MLRPNRDFKIAHVVKSEFLDGPDPSFPLLFQVYEYWNSIRGDRVGPRVGEFRIERLPPEIIPSVAVIDIVGDPPDHYYRFFGTGMVEIAGQDLTGRRYYADNISGYGFVNAELLPIMAERRAPVWTRVQWVSENGREMTTISVRLPLSEDGESVTGAVTANRFEKTGLNDA
tara:strand:- start:209 stop:724 length:516 start_codon:yes stop_codon:yes gene_type:complete